MIRSRMAEMPILTVPRDRYVDGSDPKDVAKKIRDVVFLNTMIYSLGAWRDSTGTYYEADFTL